jgi:hypothetical protein
MHNRGRHDASAIRTWGHGLAFGTSVGEEPAYNGGLFVPKEPDHEVPV